MSAAGLKRLEAVLDLRQRAVESAEQAVGVAVRKSEEAREVVREAEKRYDAALIEASKDDSDSAWELGYRRSHLETLRNRITRAGTALAEAMKEEDKVRGVLVEAKREHKKLELWCDARTREAEAEEARVERRATDEMALRGARRS